MIVKFECRECINRSILDKMKFNTRFEITQANVSFTFIDKLHDAQRA